MNYDLTKEFVKTILQQILARCVANPAYVTGSIVLGGAAPTGQGVTDKATLIGRGVSVLTN